MTREEIREVIQDTVRETLLTMGVDTKDPMSVQKDFQWVRRMRSTSEKLQSQGMIALLSILISALLAAAWLGVQSMFRSGK